MTISSFYARVVRFELSLEEEIVNISTPGPQMIFITPKRGIMSEGCCQFSFEMWVKFYTPPRPVEMMIASS